MSETALTVGEAARGKRLDRFLAGEMPNFSRAALQRAVAEGRCAVDGCIVTKPDRRLKTGQCVRLSLPERGSALQPEEGNIDILWKDDNLIVCNKPAGLTVHPCPSCPENTLVQRLISRFPQIGRMDGLRPGVVHRLDKDTSGILLLALTEPVRLALSEAFARRTVHKEYLALVHGEASETGECREPIGRHPEIKVKMAVVPEKCGGKPAHTQWQRLWLAPDKNTSLLAVRIHSGRTHQIRVHLSYLGHPLLGDKTYAPQAVRNLATRQMLHAHRIAFVHPTTGERLAFSCPPPTDMLAAAMRAGCGMCRLVLTGCPGCGKSTVAAILARRGLPVFSADKEVQRLYAAKGPLVQWAVVRFGDIVLARDGSIDKEALFAAMQTDALLKADLEETVHALVHDALENFWKAHEEAGAAIACAEVPLWFECGWHRQKAHNTMTAVVSCPAAKRRSRLENSRGWHPEKIAVIESWQWPEEKKSTAADLIIDNGASLEQLERETELALTRLDARLHEEETSRRRELKRCMGMD